ncbi:hypothetical protein PVK64_17080 [Aliivibrio sp. S4TY2]|uniref:hypothetical protein n=1 Tax=unclassified Aliivibrio TaxID=2645654 RepID=UPI002379655A|nr:MULTISPECIES: hypothetical protein [unclassified Aliivibrio]MDD9157883.1 hypothetical protein [Aliivibrio sp. S4TY2]MDD9161900.1 hypothetical protein [Aliivibrio sp. S4TY1]MDD9165883.1 hypothetical protein [Aliivibrio sp. S4MY2]MDD9169882.1 hypothetical protein [Aliivibrio sp. S4MY4]MDD9185499.1 hypothetical protein [Aliivibrio sp. S4MY3]
MAAYVQSIGKFCEETGMSRRSVIIRMDAGDIPEIPREGGKGTRYIDMVEFRERVTSGQFVLSDLSRLSKDKKRSGVIDA